MNDVEPGKRSASLIARQQNTTSQEKLELNTKYSEMKELPQSSKTSNIQPEQQHDPDEAHSENNLCSF